MDRYFVAYAKISIDKIDGISLQGVYFGGIGQDKTEAAAIARDCVNCVRGGTILPRIVAVDGDEKLIDAMYIAYEKFEQIVHDMRETDNIMNRNKNKRNAMTE